jgi:hypothetical protein
MLYALRYEDDSSIKTFKQIIKEDNQLCDKLDYIDILLNTCGKVKRHLDLFQNKDFFAKSKQLFTQVLKNVPNVYTQHISLITGLMQNLLKGKSFPELDNINFGGRENIKHAIVFVIGGITYEETRDLGNLSKALEIPIYFGGTCIHNSKR